MGCSCSYPQDVPDTKEHVVVKISSWGHEVYGPYKGFQAAMKKVNKLKATANGEYVYAVSQIQPKSNLT